ncbi:MAG: bifunctional ornithine acetyltransferase/N-acetylglutamate synthase, partial [Pseudomonadota bacterium]|nr:bifunctional ornithine acetyltransferase/N-acetylglutamate synthase [Pseudomonadota bacterium]
MAKYALSPLAPEAFPKLPVIKGARFATHAAGVRYKGREDVMMVALDAGTTIAGTFTRSATRSAPVLDCQAKLGSAPEGEAVILVNAGNSNAFTGKAGVASVQAITGAVAEIMEVSPNRVFTSSTGVIGEPLPHDRIIDALDALKGKLDENGIENAANAIMTTDTFPKGSVASFEIDGMTVNIAGIAKGSGMIAPDMATMLVYIFTDAQIAQDDLQVLVSSFTD